MRTGNSIKNSLTALIGNIIACLVAFISQAIFIKLLGIEYLGLNGLFTNILTMLSIFELGIGYAIVYNLYKPIAENDEKKILGLMNFYKKAYNFIAITIFSFGIILIPFLKYIVGDVNVEINLYIVYILFLTSTVSSYIMAYKRNLIIANQKSYIINIIHMSYLIILNMSQLIILFFTKNYYLYLIIKIICQLLENIVISIYASKKYTYLKNCKKEKIDKNTEKDIFKRVKALLFHKIGGIIVTGTDNIIISSFFSIATVGLYTNYYTITNAVSTIFSQIIATSTASVGNLLVMEDSEKRFDVFRKMRFLNTWISIFTATSILVIIQPFISIWVGSEYQLPLIVVIAIVFNYFQKSQRQVYNTFKDSAGIWIEDRFVPLVEAILNIVFSILFLKIFGLVGVFIGTIVSGLALWCYSFPKFVYNKIFNRSYFNYAKETIGAILLFLIVASITFAISKVLYVNNYFLQVIINAIICLIIPNLILYFAFRKNDSYEYFKNLGFTILKKLFNKDKVLIEKK